MLLPLVLLAGFVPQIVPAAGILIGEPAPPFVVREWVKGDAVEIKPGTNVYVVEIW